MIGVNGVGKNNFRWKTCRQAEATRARKLFLAAADTFRAAAIEQLTEWANQSRQLISLAARMEQIRHQLFYDAVAAAKARNADVLMMIRQEDFTTRRT